MNNFQPLLTIAIPTWNRAIFLDKALSYLLPQVKNHSDIVEIIISDNNSTDNTKEIIQNNIIKYHDINIKTYYQKENTGFFGNFKKCKELSNGYYFWLLSDNDYVNKNTINIIMKLLKNKNHGVIHFAYNYNNIFKDNEYYFIENIDNNELFYKSSIFLTLISAVIFRNIKKNDSLIFRKYYGNSFLGFVFLLDSLHYSNKNIIVYGKTLLVDNKAKVSFDVINSFTKDLISCFKDIDTLNKKTINNFYNQALKRVVRWHLIKNKRNNELFKQNYYRIKRYYYGKINFFLYIVPLNIFPDYLLQVLIYLYRINNKTLFIFRSYFSKMLIIHQKSIKKITYAEKINKTIIKE